MKITGSGFFFYPARTCYCSAPWSIAIKAMELALLEPHENLARSSMNAFSLYGIKNFFDMRLHQGMLFHKVDPVSCGRYVSLGTLSQDLGGFNTSNHDHRPDNMLKVRIYHGSPDQSCLGVDASIKLVKNALCFCDSHIRTS